MKRDAQPRHSAAFRIARVALLGMLLLAGSAPPLAAEPSSAEIQQLLTDGQVEAALHEARKVSSHQQRDPCLAKVSVALAEQGNRTAAIETLGEIYDHRSRWHALRALGEHFGGEASKKIDQAARGGGAEADFQSIIELMTATIQPETWDDVGGPGAVKEFAGGVHVDPQGLLSRAERKAPTGLLFATRDASQIAGINNDVSRTSQLRKVSLPRLELHRQLLAALGKRPTREMLSLAGLTRVEYVFVYPDSRDLVIAGPAGEWQENADGLQVNRETGKPVLQLDDLVEMLRAMSDGDQAFGCSITPRQTSLAKTNAYLVESAKKPLKPGQRPAWLRDLRNHVGRQDIKFWGIDPTCRAAAILVEADYRMKLVGMGLEEPVLGVTSYLDSIRVAPGEAPPPMDVLRWWFTLNYRALETTEDQLAYALRGQGVQVLSENELLTAQGKRVHTGGSDELNQAFADSFTRHFPALCEKYPIYAELRNIFDLALVAALVDSRGLAELTSWRQTAFGPKGSYATARGNAPKEVETVINHRVINRIHIVAGVSGGVSADMAPLVRGEAIAQDQYGKLKAEKQAAQTKIPPRDRWWWD